jgi:hypothetical protein
MGCDIHIYVETKNSKGDWDAIDGPNPWKKWNEDHGYSTEGESDRCYEGWIYSGRNYTLFSWLADVRNGIKSFLNEEATGHYVVPLAEPRQLPEDCCEYIRDELDDCDIHSRSYFTFAELLKGFEDIQDVKYKGLVGPGEYEEFKKNGHPGSWCGGSSAFILTNEEMDKYLAGETVQGTKKGPRSWDGKSLGRDTLKDVKKDDGEFVQTCVEWTMPIKESVEGFIDNIKEAAKLFDNLDDVRVVFGFDN